MTRPRSESAVSNVECSLKNIRLWNPVINAMITVTEDDALKQAKCLDEARYHQTTTGVLHGLTVNLKDNIDLAHIPTTAASSLLRDNIPTKNAFIVNCLQKHGAIIVGKSNLHEWMYGPTTQSEHFGPTLNPWNTEHIPGGSSGGSAAAVAIGMSDAAIGSDTGGSIRIPSAFNGITGLRPTVGRVSCSGSLGLSPPFDVLGPMARSAWDVARIYSVIAGYDSNDPYSVDHPMENVLSIVAEPIRDMRIGVMRRWYFDHLSPDVMNRINQAIEVLHDLGARIIEIDLGDIHLAHEMFSRRILPVDGFHCHQARLRDAPNTYGEDVRQRLAVGATISGPQYAEALRWIENWRHRLRDIFSRVDACLAPTVPFTAPRIDALSIERVAKISQFTTVYAAAGHPCLAVPCGLSNDFLPVSFELAGAPFSESRLLRVAHAFQSVTNFHHEAPKLSQ